MPGSAQFFDRRETTVCLHQRDESMSLALRSVRALTFSLVSSIAAPMALAADMPTRPAVDWLGFWAMVDERWPRDDSTVGARLMAFRAVEAPNIIRLDEGVAVRVAGVECTADGAEMVARLIDGQDVKIAVPAADTAVASVAVKDVRRLDFGPFGRGVLDSPVVSRPLETAIINRWCRVLPGAERSSGASERDRFPQVAADCFASRDARAPGCESLLGQFARRGDPGAD